MHRFGRRQVTRKRIQFRLGMARADCVYGFVNALLRTAIDNDARALPGQTFRDCSPDTRRRGAHQGKFSLKTKIHLGRLPNKSEQGQFYVDVIAGCLGVGAEFFVGFLNELFGLSSVDAREIHLQFGGQGETAIVSLADGHTAGHLHIAGLNLALRTGKGYRAGETGGVTAREELFGVGRSGRAGATQLLWDAKVKFEQAVRTLHVSVTTGGGGGSCGIEGLKSHS